MAKRSHIDQEPPFHVRLPDGGGQIVGRADAVPGKQEPLMISPAQIRTIDLASHQAGLDQSQYLSILRDAAGVGSSRELTQPAFLGVMSILEDFGYREEGKPENFWRTQIAGKGSLCGPWMCAKLLSLRGHDPHFPLAASCQRVSGGRVDRVDRLTPREAFELIGVLKGIARQADALTPAKRPADVFGDAWWRK
jgi:hypothetical protein